MNAETTFIDDILTGNAGAHQIISYIIFWYKGDTQLTLRHFLGFTEEDCTRWLNGYDDDVVFDIAYEKFFVRTNTNTTEINDALALKMWGEIEDVVFYDADIPSELVSIFIGGFLKKGTDREVIWRLFDVGYPLKFFGEGKCWGINETDERNTWRYCIVI